MKLFSALLLLSIAVTIHGDDYFKIWCLEACRYYPKVPDWKQRIDPEKIARQDCYPIAHAKLDLHIETFCLWFYPTRRNNPAFIQNMQQYTWEQWCGQQKCW